MNSWTLLDLLPGLYVLLLAAGLAGILRRWYDPLPWRVLATFGLLLVLLLGPVLFGGGVLLPLGNLRGCLPFKHLPAAEPPSIGLHADLVHQIAPWSVEVRRTLGQGRWPLWNSHAGAGMPLMGDPQTQAFQPLVIAAYPFPYDTAAGITAALRVLAALVFGFLLLHRQGLGEPAALCGSLGYGLGGFLLLWLGWPMANCVALLPVMLYAIALCDGEGRPRDFLLLFLATASLLLGGHPETMLYAMGFAGLFLLDRVRRRERGRWRLLVRCGLAMAIAGAAVAPVFLTALDYIPKTERASLIRQYLTIAPLSVLWQELMKPETLEAWRTRAVGRLVVIVAPRAYGDHFFFWGFGNVIEIAGGFVGSATLLAALLALLPKGGRRRFSQDQFSQDRFPQERLALFTLIACLLLLVQPPGIDRILGQLPLVGAMAVHRGQRLLLVGSFCIAYLAACEVERRTRLGIDREGSRGPVFACAAVLAALVTWGYLAHPNPQDPNLLAGYRHALLGAHLAALALGTALLTWRPARRGMPWLFCGLIVVELVLVHGPAFVPAPRRLAYPVTPPVRFLLDHLGQDRMVGLGPTTFPANFPLVYGLNDVRIDNPSLPADYSDVTRPIRRPLSYYFIRPGHPLYSLLGVRYVMVRPGVPLPWKRVLSHPAGWIYERPGPLPRLFLPARATAEGGRNWLEWLERNPDFARRSLVPGMDQVWQARRPRKSRLAVVSFPEPARVHAQGSLDEVRLLASNVYQDGHWRLLVDGKPRPTLTANGPFAAAWLPPGEHRIDLLYRPRVFVLGCFLAALAGVAAVVWWVPAPRRVVS
jgi:hypothetical protein